MYPYRICIAQASKPDQHCWGREQHAVINRHLSELVQPFLVSLLVPPAPAPVAAASPPRAPSGVGGTRLASGIGKLVVPVFVLIFSINPPRHMLNLVVAVAVLVLTLVVLYQVPDAVMMQEVWRVWASERRNPSKANLFTYSRHKTYIYIYILQVDTVPCNGFGLYTHEGGGYSWHARP